MGSRYRRGGPDRWLGWKVGMALLAVGVWTAGIIADRPEWTGAAIVLLAAAVALRFLRRDDGRSSTSDGE